MATQHAAVTTRHKPRRARVRLEQTTGVANKTVRWVLRSPFHRLLSPWLMLVTYIGRRSGNIYTTPVSYIKSDHEVKFFTASRWWHNFESPSPVILRIQGRDLHGIAQVTIDPYEIEPVVRTYLEEKGVDSAWVLGIKLKGKTVPTREGLVKVLAEGGTTMVRVHPARHPKTEN